MKKNCNIFNHKAQSLVESILILPLMFLIILSIIWFARILITKQQLLIAARYGTDLITYTTLSEKDIKQEIRNFLSHKWIQGRKLDPKILSDENIKVVIERFELPEAKFSDVINFIGFFNKFNRAMNMLINPLKHTSYVEIYYSFEIPKILSFIIGNRSNNRFFISARSEIIAGTGCQNKIHRSK